ncbi:hypothetical protein Tco_0110870, partial [Tanacetum coccineum]
MVEIMVEFTMENGGEEHGDRGGEE